MNHKKLYIIIISIIISIAILIFVSIFILRSSKKDFTSDLSFTHFTEGYSKQGVVHKNNNPPYITFMDFMSSTIIPLGINPQSTYDDKNSFANTLVETSAEFINIYNKKLYYVRTEYIYNRDEPYSIIIYEASIDGGVIKIIGEFIGYEICYEYYIVDGYMFLSLEKYNEKRSGITNKDNQIVAVGCIDLSNGDTWVFPNKYGYGTYILFLGLHDGMFYYEQIYQTRQMESSQIDDGYETFRKESYEIVRMTVWCYDVKNKVETIWDEKYKDARPNKEEDFLYFQQAGNSLYVINYIFNKWGDTAEFICYDIKTKKIINEFKVSIKDYGSFNINMSGDDFIFTNYDESGINVLTRTVFKGTTGKKTEVNNFNDYYIWERVDDKLILRTDNENTTEYFFINLDDFLKDDLSGLNIFRKGY